MRNLHIKFNSHTELKNIISVLIGKGLIEIKKPHVFNSFDKCVVSVLSEGKEFVVVKHPITKREKLTYQQFMEKHGMSDLKSKVEEAKKTLGLNNHELSLKLGHQKRYITNALLDPSVKRQKNIILKINALLLKELNDLTHDFEEKALHKHIDDAMMIGKSEYESMKKEIDHKTQIAEKHADMRAKAEAEAQEFNNKMLLAEKDSEKWQCDYWTVSRENIDLTNSKRAISIWLTVSILIIVLMAVYEVLHFNGVV